MNTTTHAPGVRPGLSERLGRLEQEIAGLAEDQRRNDEMLAEIHQLVLERFGPGQEVTS